MIHLAVFALAQAAFAVTGDSWTVAMLRDAVPGDQPLAMTASRIWLIVFAIDTVWTWWSISSREKKEQAEQQSPGQTFVTHKDDE
ncbi:MAG: hypothetical protein ACRD0P_23330 [Stackebrandtia sp.]